MAAEDRRIVLNPYTRLTDEELHAVGKNEASRLFMRDKSIKFGFPPEPHQIGQFAGTAYQGDDEAMNATILGRALSGDPSSGELSQRQKEWFNWLLPQLQAR
jgi:hypothetical protein